MNHLSPLAGRGRTAPSLLAAAVAVARAQPWAMRADCIPGCAATPAEDGATCLSCGRAVEALGGTLLALEPGAIRWIEAHWLRGETLDPPAIAEDLGMGVHLAHALAISIEDLDPHGPEVEIARVSAWIRDRKPTPPPVAPERPTAIPPVFEAPPVAPAVPAKALVVPRTPAPPVDHEPAGPALPVVPTKVRYVREAVTIPTECWTERQAERARRAGWPALSLDAAADLLEHILAEHPSGRVRAHDAQALCASRADGDGAAALAALKAYGILLPGADGRLAATAAGRDLLSADAARRAGAVARVALAPPPYAAVLGTLGPAPTREAFAGLRALAGFGGTEITAIHAGFVLAMAMRASAQAVIG